MRRGLTLIELIVIVVIVIGVLVAPAAGGAEGARCRGAVRVHEQPQTTRLRDVTTTTTRTDHFPPGTLPNSVLPPEAAVELPRRPVFPIVECENCTTCSRKAEAWDSDRNVRPGGARSFRLYQCPYWIATNDYDANLVAAGTSRSRTTSASRAGCRRRDAPGRCTGQSASSATTARSR